MKKSQRTKTKLLSSLVLLLLSMTMFLGTTFAWFTDSVTSASNVIKSGNLDVKVEYTLDGENWKDLDGANDIFTNALWEPGHTRVVALKVSNVGSLALKYNANMNIVEETVGKNKEGGDIVLSDILTVGTLVQEADDEAGIGDIAVALAFEHENMYKGTTAFKASSILEENTELFPGCAHYVIIKVDMAETVGNEANHDGENIPSIEFGLNVLATQYTHEEDSFDNQYDKDAIFALNVDSADGMNDNWDQNILITNDFTVTSENRASANYGLWAYGEIDGNGNTITDNSGAKWAGIYSESTFIKNLTLDTNSLFGIFASAKTEPLVVNNFTLNKSSNGAAFYVQNAPAGITLNDSTMTASGVANNAGTANAVVFSTTNSKITINSGTYTATDANGYVVASFYSGSTVTINGGTFKGDLYPVDEGNIVINGGTFNGKFNVLGGNLVINGGTFNSNPTGYQGTGKTVVDNGNGTWTVQ